MINRNNIVPSQGHGYNSANINPDNNPAVQFDEWARKNMKVEEYDPHADIRAEQYKISEDDKVFGAKGQDWFEEEFLDETYLKIKYSTPTSPSIIVILPKFGKVMVMAVKDVPARLRMYERHIVFLDIELSEDEIKRRYFDKLNDGMGRELFTLMKVIMIKDNAEILQFLKMWSGKSV